MITSTPTLFNALATIPVLAGTNLAAQTLLAQEGLVRDFAPGAWIVREGDEGHSFFILVLEKQILPPQHLSSLKASL